MQRLTGEVERRRRGHGAPGGLRGARGEGPLLGVLRPAGTRVEHRGRSRRGVRTGLDGFRQLVCSNQINNTIIQMKKILYCCITGTEGFK